MDNNRPVHQARLRVYFAGPLFCEAERAFNLQIVHRLEQSAEVYLPQRDGALMSALHAQGVETRVAACRVFKLDMDAILNADCLVANLDGRTIDEGTAFEIGVAFAHAKRCVGIQTDSRRLASWGNNPMISGALENIFSTVDDLVSWLENEAVVHSRPSHRDITGASFKNTRGDTCLPG